MELLLERDPLSGKPQIPHPTFNILIKSLSLPGKDWMNSLKNIPTLHVENGLDIHLNLKSHPFSDTLIPVTSLTSPAQLV
jgi:hypothetical protein